MTSASENGALGSVLDLERALETAQAASVDSEGRLERARLEADTIRASARERADRRAAQRERSLIPTADAEARALIDDAEAAAADMHAKVGEVEPAFVEAALALVLPSATRRATCSNR